MNPTPLTTAITAFGPWEPADNVNEPGTLYQWRDGEGSGRVKVATAMHRIAQQADAAIAKARGAQ